MYISDFLYLEKTLFCNLVIKRTLTINRCPVIGTKKTRTEGKVTELPYLELFHNEIGEVSWIVFVHKSTRDCVTETLSTIHHNQHYY